MGTNFYLRGGYRYDFQQGLYMRYTPGAPELESMNPEIHIGKRSVAGPYCWDCDVTLCKSGAMGVHRHANEWHDACPRCRKKYEPKNTIKEGAGAVELGFAKPETRRPTGVQSCASFSWAQPPDSFRVFADEHADERVVVNEYGDVMTAREFTAMLHYNCPISFIYINSWFG